LIAAVYWFDSPPAMDDVKAIEQGEKAAAFAFRAATPVTALAYFYFVYLAYSSFGSPAAVWQALWTDANASVAFMTIDTLILYVGVCIYIAFRSWPAFFKTLLLSPLIGPAAACWTLAEVEEDTPRAAQCKI